MFKTHTCFGVDYPPGGIVCICALGKDHDESLFDIEYEEED